MFVDHYQQHYIGNLALDELKHTADNIRFALKELVARYKDRIMAICTDSPKVMVRMRADYCAGTNVFDLSCILHSINLVCKDIIKSGSVANGQRFANDGELF